LSRSSGRIREIGAKYCTRVQAATSFARP
jgi:hypothetical protein